MIDLHVSRQPHPAPSAHHPEAQQRGREVLIFPKFDRLPSTGTKRHVLFHELGHWFRQEHVEYFSINGMWSPSWPNYAGVYDRDTAEEGFAEAFATYFIDPGHLRSRYPALYTDMEKRVAPLERDLLRWVSDAIVKTMRESKMTTPRAIVLVEADPVRDARFRKIAEHAYDVMRAWLTKNAGEIDDLLPRSKRWGGWVVSMAEMDGRSGRGGKWSDLMVVFATKEHLPALGKSGDGRTFYMVLPVLLGPFVTRHLTSRTYGVRTAFVHEFIHYLDEKRYPAGTAQGSANKRRAGDIKGYFNTPAEFNAYYQEGASKLISDIDTTVALSAQQFSPRGKEHPKLAIFRKAVKGSARDWMAWLRSQPYWSVAFLEATKNTKWERKFLTRAFLLQQTARKRV